MDIDHIRTGIAALTPSPAKASKRQLIALMIAEIDAALARGISLEQLKAYLDGQGFDLGLSTLRQYVADARKAGGKKRKARRAAGKPVVVPSPQPAPKAAPGTDSRKFVTVKDEDL